MRKVLILIAPAILLAGCSVFGGGKQKSLDEFAVARNAPLVIPPDYSLTPPIAGTVSMTAQDAQGQAIQALFGGPAPRSGVETSALQRAGNAEPGIRTAVGDPGTFTVDKGSTTRAIIAAPEGDGQDARAVAG